MKNVINPCRVSLGKRNANVYIKINHEKGNLSISGVEGPLPSGNALGGCGQIGDDLKVFLKNRELFLNPGWTDRTLEKLLGIWKRWHLNDLRAECEHQRALGWTYKEHKGKLCPTCGYEIGTKWFKEEIPQDVIDWLFALPVTEKEPAWV